MSLKKLATDCRTTNSGDLYEIAIEINDEENAKNVVFYKMNGIGDMKFQLAFDMDEFLIAIDYLSSNKKSVL